MALVDFGTGFNGHDGNGVFGVGRGGPGTFWWVKWEELNPITLPEFKSTPKATRSVKREVNPEKQRSLPPQSAKVLAVLKAKGSITSLEAAGVLRVRSLSRRIVDIKDAGYTIVRALSKDTTGQRYARYYLKGEPAQAAA